MMRKKKQSGGQYEYSYNTYSYNPYSSNSYNPYSYGSSNSYASSNSYGSYGSSSYDSGYSSENGSYTLSGSGPPTEEELQDPNIKQLSNAVEQSRQNAEVKRQAYTQAIQEYNSASEVYMQKVSEKAALNADAEIKIQASANANATLAQKQTNRNTAQGAKVLANSEVAAAEQAQSTLQAKLAQAEQDLLSLNTDELSARADRAQIAKATAESQVSLVQKEVSDLQAIKNQKQAAFEQAARLDAVQYDATGIANLRMWFDAASAQGTTTWTSKVSSPSFSLTGQFTIKQQTSTPNLVSVSSAQSLSLNPTDSLAEFTLFIVCRQIGPNRNFGFRGTDTSRTNYGYNTGARKNYFSLGNIETPVASTTPSDNAWDLFCFTRNATGKGEGFNLGKKFADLNNTTQGFAGLTLNTTTLANSKSDMDIGEILLFNRVLTQDERQKLEGILIRKWNFLDRLDSAHPFKTNYPDLYGLTGGGKRKKKRSTKLKRKTKKVRKARKRHTHRR
jgi:hypothetical protein